MTHANTPAFDRLLDGYLQQTLTDEEVTAFFDMLQQPQNQLRLQEVLEDDLKKQKFSGLAGKEQMEAAFQQLAGKINKPAPVRRIYMRWVAAAAVLFVVCSLWFVVDRWQDKSLPVPQQAKIDVAPGRDQAILTLSDGRQVLLDSAGNGVIAEQSGAQVVLQDGKLTYKPLTIHDSRLTYNTMSTPRGGQYQLTLPDGSKVWLNAASSITYPTAFTANDRRVSITGEVYFEVVKNAQLPFIVTNNGSQEVEVLGTHFNINSYGDDASIKTTLLEGKVKVSATQPETKNQKPETILFPGQQSQLTPNKLTTTNNIDIDKVMAWKNGFFNFEGMPLKEVMKQLERWYDITVVYEQGVPEISFFGEISRNLSLADLTNALKDVGVHFRIEAGRRLVVLP